jgi:hypothetical protein
MSAAEDAAALAAYPELQRLIDLREAGWRFMPLTEGGELVELRGLRTWSGTGCADALRVRYSTDARGLRVDHTGAVIWQRDGTLGDVVDGLISLPAPGNHPHCA